MAFEASSDNHVLIDRGSEDLLVVFSGASRQPGQFDFRGYAARSSHSILLLNNGVNRWYQDGVPSFGETIDDFIAEVKSTADRIGSKRLHFAGGSMGGYAAILFGTLFRSPALAFAADTRLRVPHSHSARLMVGQSVIPDLRPLIAASREPIHLIVGGMDVLDMVGADHVRKYCHISCEPKADHGITGYLRDLNKIDATMDKFVAGDLEVAEKTIPPTEVIKLLYNIKVAAAAGHRSEVEAMSEAASKLAPDNLLVRKNLAHARFKARKYTESTRQFSDLLQELPADKDFHLYYGLSLLLSGEKELAEIELHDHLGRWPSCEKAKQYLKRL